MWTLREKQDSAVCSRSSPRSSAPALAFSHTLSPSLPFSRTFSSSLIFSRLRSQVRSLEKQSEMERAKHRQCRADLEQCKAELEQARAAVRAQPAATTEAAATPAAPAPPPPAPAAAAATAEVEAASEAPAAPSEEAAAAEAVEVAVVPPASTEAAAAAEGDPASSTPPSPPSTPPGSSPARSTFLVACHAHPLCAHRRDEDTCDMCDVSGVTTAYHCAAGCEYAICDDCFGTQQPERDGGEAGGNAAADAATRGPPMSPLRNIPQGWEPNATDAEPRSPSEEPDDFWDTV